VITLDTSAVLALLNEGDPDHGRTREALRADRGPFLVPAGILSELAYMLENWVRPQLVVRLLNDLETGTYSLDCGEVDLPRIGELVQRYADLPLGFADAAVIACAERNGGRVLTLDVRDFGVVAREGTIRLLPD